MSFLDEDQATAGRISLGTRRAGLESLLPRRRRQTARQQQTSGYDILPSTMQPIPGVVSTPTDIAQVGVGPQLQQQQGTTAAQVPNVFEKYAETGAAPIGDFRQYLYPSPPTEEDEEEENDVIEATNEKFAENFGFDPYDPQTSEGQYNLSQQAAAETAAAQEASILGGRSLPFSQAAKAAIADITGSRAYLDSVFNYSLTGDVNVTPTAAQINESEFGPQGGGWGTAGAPGYTPPTAPQSAYTPVDPSADLSFGDDGGDGGGDGGTGFGSGGIEAAAAAGVFASGGIVTKSKTKNKTSFMSMKGK
jgi:hypothetical protein